MINITILGGYIGTDPETAILQAGQKVCRFRLCTTERGYLTKTGQQIPDRNTWHNVNLWGNLANYAATIHKGQFIVLRGIYHTREVANEQTGEVRTYYNFDANEVMWTPPKEQTPQAQTQPTQAPQPAQTPQAQTQDPQSNDDGLPF